MRLNLEALFWKSGWPGDAARSHYFTRGNLRPLHRWKRVLHKLPVIGRVLLVASRPASQRHRLSPRSFRVSVSAIVTPAPIVLRAVNSLAVLRCEISIHLRSQSLAALFLFHLPRGIGIRRAFLVSLSVQKESRPLAHLSDRGTRSKMPHRCRQRVSPRMQQRRNVVRLVSPVPQVRAARPSARLFPVHIKNKLVVRADVHNEMR